METSNPRDLIWLRRGVELGTRLRDLCQRVRCAIACARAIGRRADRGLPATTGRGPVTGAKA